MSYHSDLKDELIEEENRNLELSGHISLDIKNDEKKDESETPKGFNENYLLSEKKSLEDMGFPRALIDKIYAVIRPANIEEALDYLSRNEKDVNWWKKMKKKSKKKKIIFWMIWR